MTLTGAARTDTATGARPRFALVDAVRGAAIIGVVIYHLFWDLSYFWLIPIDVSTQPAWVAFARGLLATFILLVGVSLVLAHRNGIRWNPFWRRLAIVGGAALLVTIGTYVAFPATFVYFGVLHAIALFSLLGLAFLAAPLWLVLALAVAAIAAPLLYTHPVFSEPQWSWIGFWAVPPPTNDLVPIFPWFGVTLLGIGLTRWALDAGAAERIGHWHANGRASRALLKAGRWSLIIYLVHQPLLLAVIYPLATYAFDETTSVNAFNRTCEATCLNTGNDAAYCTTYCACARDEIATRNLWDAVEAPQQTPEQSQAVAEVIFQCSGVIFAPEVLE
jgi:uncharacterized membrane protein